MPGNSGTVIYSLEKVTGQSEPAANPKGSCHVINDDVYLYRSGLAYRSNLTSPANASDCDDLSCTNEMSICGQCRKALSWASLHKEDRLSSDLTWRRPSRLGDSQTIDHHVDCAALLASASTCHICEFLSSFIPSAEPKRGDFLASYDHYSLKLVETRTQRSLATCLQLERWEPDGAGYTNWLNTRSSRMRSPIIGVCQKSSQCE